MAFFLFYGFFRCKVPIIASENQVSSVRLLMTGVMVKMDLSESISPNR